MIQGCIAYVYQQEVVFELLPSFSIRHPLINKCDLSECLYISCMSRLRRVFVSLLTFENNSSDSTSIFNQLASSEHNAVIKQDTQREI